MTTTTTAEQLLTLPQVADRLQVSLDTVRRLVRRREIASVNVGARAVQHRVPAGEVDRFIAARTTPPLAAVSPLRRTTRTA